LRVPSAALPTSLRSRLVPGHAEPLKFYRDLPVPPRASYLDRTDPNVAAIAGYLLHSALDPRLPKHERPARRCGVMRTSAVPRRTTLLLVRFRFRLELPGRDKSRQLVAEDAKLVAYRGRAASTDWLPDDEALALTAATPTGNVQPDQAIDFAEQAINDLPAAIGHLDQLADQLAEQLCDAHIRVREAAGQRVRRQITVRPLKPADVLGVYVYLPGQPSGGQS
jgi:hypothetical protein